MLGGVAIAPDRGVTAARVNVEALAFLGSGTPLPMRGCALFAELTAPAASADSIPLRVEIVGPDDSAVLMDDRLIFGPPGDTVRAARLSIPLDAYAFPKIGTYIFKLVTDGVVLCTLTLESCLLSGTATALFTSFLQDEQGIQGADRYMTARFPFMLQDSQSRFAGYHSVQLSQREGDNFEVDALILKFAPGGEPLESIYDFRVAMHRAFDHYSESMFGGKFAEGSSIRMSSNLIQHDHIETFQVPDASAGAAW
jgi:hypothetical protein